MNDSEKKTIQAIYLNSTMAIAVLIEIEPTLKAIYAQLNCRTIEAAFPFKSKDLLYVDEEGLFNGHQFGFSLSANNEPLYHGDGLIVGIDGDQTVNTSLRIFDIMPFLKFYRLELESSLIPKGKG